MNKFYTLLLSIIVFSSCNSDKITADTIFINSTIWTGNPKNEYAEAFAIKADTIFSIGSLTEIEKLKNSSTKIIDLQNKFVFPGFIDSHVHLLMGGNALLSVELRDAKTKEIFIDRIAKHTKKLSKNEWIVEGNWDHTLWGGELPTKEWIDEFTSENPVAVYRLDGHMILANSAALKIAGIDKNTQEVENGEIVRHKDGTPTGILKSKAMYLVLNKIPELNNQKKEIAITKAQAYLLSQGITSIVDVDSLGGYQIVDKMRKEGILIIRIYSADPLYKWNSISTENTDEKWLKNGLLKGFVDGSLGSHTAAFTNEYSDKKGYKGIFISDIEDIYNWGSKADKQNFQITVHAIGDKANSSLLDSYQKLIKQNGEKDRRLRIEHAQHLLQKDIERFAKLGVIASVQPYHAIDDGRWAEHLIGSERIQTTYAFKSLLDSKATVVFGSDWPVAPASPLLGIYAAVTRRTLDDKNPDGWIPSQKISILQALNAYTKDAAFATFNDDIKGTLEVGKLADFIILDKDLLKTDPTKIKNIKVLSTYVAGKKVFEKK
jgi:predicted amidohydrolase YtcJ